MRFSFQLAILLFVLLFQSGCLVRNSLQEGIVCFREQNYRLAFIRLKPEANKGQPDAMYAVGYMYYYGQGVIEDKKRAWIWIRRAAAMGQPDAVRAVKILKSDPGYIPQASPLDPLIFEEPQ